MFIVRIETYLFRARQMFPSKITLPILLVSTLAACAANTGTPAPSTQTTAADSAARGTIVLLNRTHALRVMQREYPALLRDAHVTGEVFVRVTLGAEGRVSEAEVLRATHPDFWSAASRVARQLLFSPPAAAGERVTVRMHFAPSGLAEADVSIVR